MTINAVYFVEAAHTDKHFNPIAIRPTIFNERCDWEDTSRGAFFYYEALEIINKNEPPKTIKLIGTDDSEVTLTLMTVNIFNSKVKPNVFGDLQFDSDDALQKYYLTEEFPSC